MTVTNSSIHDNACKGLWADLNGDGATIINNVVANNWDEGIFIEISSGATITGNTVTGNGHRNYNGGGSGCPWLFGGGITLNSSDHALIRGNQLSGNCNGITGVQQDRPAGHPGLLEDVTVDGTVNGRVSWACRGQRRQPDGPHIAFSATRSGAQVFAASLLAATIRSRDGALAQAGAPSTVLNGLPTFLPTRRRSIFGLLNMRFTSTGSP
jgi:parallel beta-helix repeat protein